MKNTKIKNTKNVPLYVYNNESGYVFLFYYQWKKTKKLYKDDFSQSYE